MEKGGKIRFVKGTYVGKTGWYAERGMTSHQVYVIVDMGDEQLEARVNQDSVRRDSVPSSYLDAALQQHHELEALMGKLVLLLARCKIEGKHAQDASSFFLARLVEANETQQALGDKALWKKVTYKKKNE
jgi:hypothetical protein